jgi:hypothetical protein
VRALKSERPHAVPRGGTPCAATPWRGGPDRERFQRPPGAILAPSGRLRRTRQFKAYLARATCLSSNIILLAGQPEWHHGDWKAAHPLQEGGEATERGRAELKRAQLELSVIESQLRSRGLLEGCSSDRSDRREGYFHGKIATSRSGSNLSKCNSWWAAPRISETHADNSRCSLSSTWSSKCQNRMCYAVMLERRHISHPHFQVCPQ